MVGSLTMMVAVMGKAMMANRNKCLILRLLIGGRDAVGPLLVHECATRCNTGSFRLWRDEEGLVCGAGHQGGLVKA